MTKYMHTIESRPATFDGYQICFAVKNGKPNILCDSLAQIKKEQRLTKKNRLADGFEFDLSIYSHLRYE